MFYLWMYFLSQHGAESSSNGIKCPFVLMARSLACFLALSFTACLEEEAGMKDRNGLAA